MRFLFTENFLDDWHEGYRCISTRKYFVSCLSSDFLQRLLPIVQGSWIGIDQAPGFDDAVIISNQSPDVGFVQHAFENGLIKTLEIFSRRFAHRARFRSISVLPIFFREWF